jgi:hypothetical protein
MATLNRASDINLSSKLAIHTTEGEGHAFDSLFVEDIRSRDLGQPQLADMPTLSRRLVDTFFFAGIRLRTGYWCCIPWICLPFG